MESPTARNTWPVIVIDASDARNTTIGAEFAGFIGVNSVYSSGSLSSRSVTIVPASRVIPPGQTTLARTP